MLTSVSSRFLPITYAAIAVPIASRREIVISSFKLIGAFFIVLILFPLDLVFSLPFLLLPSGRNEAKKIAMLWKRYWNVNHDPAPLLKKKHCSHDSSKPLKIFHPDSSRIIRYSIAPEDFELYEVYYKDDIVSLDTLGKTAAEVKETFQRECGRKLHFDDFVKKTREVQKEPEIVTSIIQPSNFADSPSQE